MSRTLLTLSLLFVASAAAASYEPSYTYNRIYVVNDSQDTLGNVTVEDTRHGRTHSCGDIAPMATCTLAFGSRSYRQNPLRVSWAQGDAARQTEELQLKVPLTLASGPVIRGVITVGADGSLSSSADQPARR